MGTAAFGHVPMGQLLTIVIQLRDLVHVLPGNEDEVASHCQFVGRAPLDTFPIEFELGDFSKGRPANECYLIAAHAVLDCSWPLGMNGIFNDPAI